MINLWIVLLFESFVIWTRTSYSVLRFYTFLPKGPPVDQNEQRNSTTFSVPESQGGWWGFKSVEKILHHRSWNEEGVGPSRGRSIRNPESHQISDGELFLTLKVSGFFSVSIEYSWDRDVESVDEVKGYRFLSVCNCRSQWTQESPRKMSEGKWQDMDQCR